MGERLQYGGVPCTIKCALNIEKSDGNRLLVCKARFYERNKVMSGRLRRATRKEAVLLVAEPSILLCVPL